MNERIKELAVQSHLSWCMQNDFDRQNLQKFAELLIKECMEVSRPFYMGTPEDSVYYVEQAINRIAEHFGVE
jgi:hypothetical protein